MIISDSVIFLLVFGVFAMLAAAVADMTRKFYKKKLVYLKQYAEAAKTALAPTAATQELHYISPPPPPEYLAPPPPPAQAAQPTPIKEKQQEATPKHDYTVKIDGEQPAEPRSFFQSTAFKLIGASAAVIIGLLAYIFIFLPK
jgi:hypothetical protein